MHEAFLTAYQAARKGAALIEMKNKGMIRLFGSDAGKLIATLLCGDVRSIPVGCERFSPMLNMQGGTMDAVQVLHPEEDVYWLIITESNREKIMRHIQRQMSGDVKAVDLKEWARLLLLIGPEASSYLEKVPDDGELATENHILGQGCMACCFSRLGTPGYWVVTGVDKTQDMVDTLLQNGVVLGDLDVLNTLMLEVGMPAYGRELDDTVNPLETRLRRHVHLHRPGFIGREALVAAGEPRRVMIGLKLEEEGALPGMDVVKRDKQVGTVTSAGYCPGVGSYAALALVEAPYQDAGSRLSVECGGRLIRGVVSALPFELLPDEEEEQGEAAEE